MVKVFAGWEIYRGCSRDWIRASVCLCVVVKEGTYIHPRSATYGEVMLLRHLAYDLNDPYVRRQLRVWTFCLDDRQEHVEARGVSGSPEGPYPTATSRRPATIAELPVSRWIERELAEDCGGCCEGCCCGELWNSEGVAMSIVSARMRPIASALRPMRQHPQER